MTPNQRGDWLNPLGRMLGLREALASVALSHPAGHGCDVCLAARGDLMAFARLAAAMDDMERER